jgi:hypothetical protein
VVQKLNKRTDRRTTLPNVRALLNQWNDRRRTKAIITFLEIVCSPDNHTSASLSMETLHNKYFMKFTNAFECVRFLLKHKMLSIQDILKATDKKLKRIVFNAMETYEISRIERKIRYSDTRDNS